MSGVECQTLADATQFDGLTVTTGLFRFTRWQEIPRTTRVVLTALSYVELDDGVPLTTNVQFWAVKPGGLATEKMPLGDGTAAGGLLDINGDARLRLCGIVLPREPGDGGIIWDVQVLTQNKTETATACLDFVLCPYPDTNERDSPDR